MHLERRRGAVGIGGAGDNCGVGHVYPPSMLRQAGASAPAVPKLSPDDWPYDKSLWATTGVSRPFTSCSSSAIVTTSQVSARNVASERTVSPAEANCCRRWDRFTVSPTRV